MKSLKAVTTPDGELDERAHVLRRLALVGVAALVGGLVAGGAPPAEAASHVPLAESGLSLSATDDAGADVLLGPTQGRTMTATVRPAGCVTDDCTYVATAENPRRPQVAVSGSDDNISPRTASAGTPTAITESGPSVVVAVNGASVDAVSDTPMIEPRIGLYQWSYIHDWMCSNLSCTAWRMNLGSKAYCDSNKWCWGTRRRYGLTGDINCSQSGNGYSISQNDCSFHVDPSKTALYASNNSTLSLLFSGFPFSRSHFMHRHYKLTRTWLVVG